MRTLITLALLALPTLALAGPLADALDQDEANLYFSFETREGVWGNGDNVSIHLGDDREFHRGSRGWRGRDMTEGPAHVWIRLRDGRLRDMDVEVGGDPRVRSSTTDLGVIDPAEVREEMLRLAETSTDSDADEAIFCALITEGFDEWERVIAIARDDARPDDVRESAIFWLGQEASAVATAGLEEIVEDDDVELELREHAIFSLSQQGIDRCFGALSKVALESKHPQLREQAFFWLAQHDDPRVIDLLEDVLLQ
jgi:hypothetical protein